MTVYKSVSKCRLCGGSLSDVALDLGEQALTGVFPHPGEAVSRGPVQVVYCVGECGLVQLAHSYDPNLMYGATYGYRSGLNASMVGHLRYLAAEAAKVVGPGDLVVDVGSNDGTFLNFVKSARPESVCVGVDPAADKFASFYRPDVNYEARFFSPEVVAKYDKPKVVASIAMFYDLDEPLRFAQQVADLLHDDGVWLVEQLYAPHAVARGYYDAVVAEHVAYYGMRQMVWLAERAGLTITGVDCSDTNGGSFALALRHRGSRVRESSEVAELLARERTHPLVCWSNAQAQRHRDVLVEVVRGMCRRGQVVSGYGASTKGNALLQFCSFTSDDLACVVDVNPDKFGCVTPGTGIPIVAEGSVDEPDAYLVLPWHFRDGITRRLESFIAGGGKLVFPFPQVEVVGRGGLRL